jgi:hypothetical protein
MSEPGRGADGSVAAGEIERGARGRAALVYEVRVTVELENDLAIETAEWELATIDNGIGSAASP